MRARGPRALAAVAGLAAAALLAAALASGGGGGGEGAAGGAETEAAGGEAPGSVLAQDVERVVQGLGDAGAAGATRDALASAEVESRASGRGVEEEAACLLEERRRRGDCVLAHAGYLDFLGRTWGCVVQGAGWVELCVVRQGADGTGSEVVVWRMDAGDVEASLGSS